MKIIVLGAGRVGETVAENLASEQNDITVIDQDPVRLAKLRERLDVKIVAGNGLQPSVLRAAGAEDADMLIAVAALDETNLVACQVAARIFNLPTRIARVRSTEFDEHPDLLGEGGFSVNHMICPEQTVTDTISKLIEFPEALQVLEFAAGRVSLIAVRAYAGGPLVRQPIHELRSHIPNVETRIVAIFRNDRAIRPDGNTMIEPGDEVFFLAASENIRAVMAELRRMDRPVRRVMIAGGGRIGLRLARALGARYEVKLIERTKARAEYLAREVHPSVVVLEGDVTDEELLADEGVDSTDLFVAVTSDDENNIMAGLLAKRMGANRTIALINRRAYAELMQGSRIDIAIVPAQATIGRLLTYVRRGDMAAVHSLRRGAAEALEAVAHGDAASSKVVGRRVEQLALPGGAMIGAIVRRAPDGSSTVLIAHHDTVIESDDHVIVFCDDRRQVPAVEKLFQVNIGFF
jgi:trk system potassium uptake protein TrkA